MLIAMKKINIKSVIRKKKFKYNKLKFEYYSTKENIFNRNFKEENINEKWSTDIAYLFHGNGKKKLIYQRLNICLTTKLLHIRQVNF